MPRYVSQTAICVTWLRQRVVLLAAQDVEMQGLEQLGTVVVSRLAVDLALAEHQSLITRPGADQMQRAVLNRLIDLARYSA